MSLPNEILFLIVQYLSDTDIAKACLLSSDWLSVCQPILFRGPFDPLKLFKFLKHLKPHRFTPLDLKYELDTRHLQGKRHCITDDFVMNLSSLVQIDRVRLIDCYRLTPIGMSTLLQNQLRVLEMVRLDTQTVLFGQQRISDLKQLRITSHTPMHFKFKAKAVDVVLEKPRNDLEDAIQLEGTRHLKLCYINLDWNLIDVSHLVTLDVQGCGFDDYLLTRIANTARLTKLFTKKTLISDQGIESLVVSESAKTLEWLQISDSSVTLESIKLLSLHLKLKWLDLAKNRYIDRKQLYELLLSDHFTSVQTLAL
ncbi:hypothetical protein EDD86DRAFT_219146 [Gorgonomyces haynaldii]|nr:hypothetical protein EDD86DRAFT_219146 [Gorgonomyces haynaldii]